VQQGVAWYNKVTVKVSFPDHFIAFYTDVQGAIVKIQDKKKRIIIGFSVSLIVILAVLLMSMVRNNAFNRQIHERSFAGDELFSIEENREEGLWVRIAPRSSTWTKIFDLEGTGSGEPDYQAYTYDFYVSNNTEDEVSSYTYKFTFDREAYLMSAWNGSLEIHQGDYVATVPDLREFNPDSYELDTVSIDGEVLVRMQEGDYLVYIPSPAENAKEIPLEAYEGVTPGIIMYIPIGEDINGSTLELEYTFHRELWSEPLFITALAALGLWSLALVICIVIMLQIRKYALQHEHDLDMIREAIETFTGFIDAKDPYTNGHSNRVAEYTKMIAEELGFTGEELDRIYYVALLHDCGKIGVPDNILCKPGKLTDDEFTVIKSHTTRGREILSSFKSLKDVDEGALYHHERYDGKGYPEGRKGEDIPLIARMICVADSFDAMNSNRVYRKRLTKEAIIEEIENNKGTQFDPKIADILLRLIKSGKIDMS